MQNISLYALLSMNSICILFHYSSYFSQSTLFYVVFSLCYPFKAYFLDAIYFLASISIVLDLFILLFAYFSVQCASKHLYSLFSSIPYNSSHYLYHSPLIKFILVDLSHRWLRYWLTLATTG